jgi:hypothetical protein
MSKTKGVGAFLLAIIVFIALALGGLAWRYYTAELRGRVDAQEQIESAPSRIQRYQEFFNLCQSIQTKEDAIDNLRANSTMDEERKGTAITANQNARAQLINEYNSKSAQSYTAARFKASNLAYQIPRGPYENSRTNCITQ